MNTEKKKKGLSDEELIHKYESGEFNLAKVIKKVAAKSKASVIGGKIKK